MRRIVVTVLLSVISIVNCILLFSGYFSAYIFLPEMLAVLLLIFFQQRHQESEEDQKTGIPKDLHVFEICSFIAINVGFLFMAYKSVESLSGIYENMPMRSFSYVLLTSILILVFYLLLRLMTQIMNSGKGNA